MKTLILLLTVFLYSCMNPVQYNQDKTEQRNVITAECSIKNFVFNSNYSKLSFDLYTHITSADSFRMGTSLFTFTINGNTFRNPVLNQMNPKYTIGSGVGYYPMRVVVDDTSYKEPYLYVQITHFSNNGIGNLVNHTPEKICNITVDILNPIVLVEWDDELTYVTNTHGVNAEAELIGHFEKIIPNGR